MSIWPKRTTRLFLDEIAMGLHPGFSHKTILGYNDNVNGILEDVIESGAIVTPTPSSAILMRITSTSIEDIPGGTGVATTEIHGLDSNYNEIGEVGTLSGTAFVLLGHNYLRINDFHTTSAGIGRIAFGTLLLQDLSAGTTYSQISSGGNQSLQCFFTIPNNKIGYIESWACGAVTTAKDTVARIILRATEHNGTLIPGLFHFKDIRVVQDGSISNLFKIPKRIPAKCDIKVSAQKMAGNGLVEASASFCLYYG